MNGRDVDCEAMIEEKRVLSRVLSVSAISHSP